MSRILDSMTDLNDDTRAQMILRASGRALNAFFVFEKSFVQFVAAKKLLVLLAVL